MTTKETRRKRGFITILKATAYVCFAMLSEACTSPVQPQQEASREPAVIRIFAEQFLGQIIAEDWAHAWQGAVIGDVYYSEQDKDQPWDLGFSPVWYAEVTRAGSSTGYLMWDISPPHRLLELGMDIEDSLVSDGKRCQVLNDVGNLQQFPVKGKIAPQVVSGCVPTSAANVVAYWAEHGFPQWQGGTDPRAIARRLRDALPVSELIDTTGYIDTGLPLTGAPSTYLVPAIAKDANEHNVQVNVSMARFSRRKWKREIAAGRPVLLNCTVRLPHKPQLSWGHEVTGIGWMVFNGDFFVMIRDNAYPTRNASAVRALRAKGLGPIILVAPK